MRDVAAGAHVPQVFSRHRPRSARFEQLSGTTGYPPSSSRWRRSSRNTCSRRPATHEGGGPLRGRRRRPGRARRVAAGSRCAGRAPARRRPRRSARRRRRLGRSCGGSRRAARTRSSSSSRPGSFSPPIRLALLGWQPQVYVGTDVTGTPFPRLTSRPPPRGRSPCSGRGIPATARFAHDPGAKLAARCWRTTAPARPSGAVVAGWRRRTRSWTR